MVLFDVTLIEVKEDTQRVVAFCRVVAENPAQAAQQASQHFGETLGRPPDAAADARYHLVAVALAPVPDLTRRVITPTAQEVIQVARH